ncbi:protein BIG GRAIN 1-like C [Mangifera indica]|uniref:protein BIG GRAIN 1-like C n=1 Tax=Mangifera indica TaxID=29780 RepID=UPI001CFBE416|nr:protein BIG GRAIN 1-like C [Mangifera indica]
MYKREKESSLRENNILPQRRRTPSFSSSLLDAIYRSIDDTNNVIGVGGGEDSSFHREKKTMLKKQRNFTTATHGGSLEEYSNFRGASVIENWMEKQSSLGCSMHFPNSASSSSDSSSSGGLFSSSETGSSSYKEKSTRSKAVRYSMKCIQFEQMNEESRHCRQTPKREGGGFKKTKLKAMKMYDELKKVKQPISPGGRITSFFNSIFSSGNAKKVNLCAVKAMEDVNFDRKSESTCSSASRSCLSKTPSSTKGKYSSSNGGMKRSVRFYPVSVIVDEDCRPCGHKCIYEDDPSLTPLPTAHQQILKSCSFKEDPKKNEFVGDDDEEEEDDDALSYSSSDLFELDHLIGIGRYREELPVYETTNLKTNQAIAKGLIL